MLRIDSLRVENFMGFRKATIPLGDYHGLTQIEGHTSRAWSRSNGAGKSAILDAIAWALYGKPLRPEVKADRIRHCRATDKENTVVEVGLSDGEQTLVVRRRRTARGRTHLDVAGMKQGTVKGTQESLETWLGYDYAAFVSTVTFGGATSRFCQATDAQRKAILEKLIGLSWYIKAANPARDSLRAVNEDVERLETEQRSAEAVLAETKDELDKQRDAAEQYDDSVDVKRRNLLRDIADASDRMWDALYAKWAAKETYMLRVKEFDANRSKALKALQDIEDEEREIRERVAELNGQHNAVKEQIKELRKELQRAEKGKHPDICPTCDQPWPRRGAEINTKPFKIRLDDAEKRAAAIVHKIEREESRMRRLEREAMDEEGDAVEPDDAAVRQFGEQVVKLRAKRDALIAQMTVLDDMAGTNPHLERAKALESKYERLVSEFRDNTEEIEQGRRTARILAFWVKGFSRTGLPSMLLDEASPFLNRAIKPYLADLTDDAARVRFDASKEKGKSTVFDVAVEFDDGGNEYALGSGGESSRIDLAVLLAIRDLRENMSGRVFGQIFIDEVFDGLDVVGLERVSSMLRKRFCNAGVDVFLITHTDELKSDVDGSILVKKVGDASVCKELNNGRKKGRADLPDE